MVGPIIVLVGVLFLLGNIGLISPVSWSIIWPVLLIVLGISMMQKHGKWGRRCWCGCGKDCGKCEDTETPEKK